MEHQYFIETFGILNQHKPKDSTTLACFPIAWGVQGKLHIDREEWFLRFTIEENKFGGDILAFLED